MTVAMWIINVILAIIFLATGVMHVARTPEQLAGSGMGWATEVSPAMVNTIGALEIIGAFGLILPIATGIAPFLAPVAAICLALVMAGAIAVHAKRSESVVVELVLMLACVASAIVGGFATF